MNLQDKMTYIANAFEVAKRNDGSTYTRIKAEFDKALDGMMLAIHEGVDGRLPDDWVYEKTAELADGFTQYSSDCIPDSVCDVVETAVDIYTSDLTKWLAMHNGNLALVNEAVEDMGDAGDIERNIMLGQHEALYRIACALVEWANNNL